MALPYTLFFHYLERQELGYIGNPFHIEGSEWLIREAIRI